MLDSQLFSKAYDMLKNSNSILLTTHQKMDGDGLSSMLAMYKLLKERMGKDVLLLCHDATVPEVFRFLPHTDSISFEFSQNREFVISVANQHAEVEQVRYVAREDGGADIVITPRAGNFDKTDFTFRRSKVTYDTIVVMDSGDLRHLGHIYENNKDMFEESQIINIDHHASNEMFGTINLVDVEAVSTTEVIYHFLKAVDPEAIDSEIATNIMTGIIVDTRSFQNSNTTARSLEIASELLQYGAKQQEIIRHVYKTKKLSTLKLWGKVLTRLQYDQQYRFVWSYIAKSDLEELHAMEAESDGIIDDLMSNAPNADIIVLFKEGRDDMISVSMRTKRPEVNAIEIVKEFGGGGHKQAAGCKIPALNLKEAEEKVLQAVRDYQLRNDRIEAVGIHSNGPDVELSQDHPTPLFDEAPKTIEKKEITTSEMEKATIEMPTLQEEQTLENPMENNSMEPAPKKKEETPIKEEPMGMSLDDDIMI